MTPEEQAAAAAAAAETAAKEKADAEFETSLADLPDAEKEAKRAERQQHTDNELNLDRELEAERKRTADAEIARKAFLERQGRKTPEEAENEDEVDEADKPLTRRELAAMEERIKKDALKGQALILARALASSDKEAELIALKWENRTYTPGMSLQAQVNEAYAVTHTNRLIGERNEALRALRSKDNATDTSAESHRDGAPMGEPNMPPGDKAVLASAGFSWDSQKRVYKKSIGRRGFLYKDPKTGRTFPGA